jgi:hypothetical protein
MTRSTRAVHPRLVAALRAPARLLTTARWLLYDEVFMQGTRVERPTFWARFQGRECAGDVGRHATAKQLTGAAATDGDGWVCHDGVGLGDPRAPVDLSEAWRGEEATLSGWAEAVHGEVAVVAGNSAVEGFSDYRL